jgi:hypothetical protein
MRLPVRALAVSVGSVLALLAARPAAAQTDQTGLIQGRVTGEGGLPLAEAQVSAAQPDGSYRREVRTDASGAFRVNFLVPGTYVVRVRLLGHRPVDVAGVRVRAAASTPVDVALVRSTTELAAVQVVAAPNAISRATVEVAPSVLAERERELLPTPRDANALIQFTPGARPNQVFGGSTEQANLYQLDGVQANQPGRGGAFLQPNVDWIESVEVKGLGAGAEYGNFQGGLVNIVTKSGSNTFQGAFRSFFENSGLNATNINAREQGSQLARRQEYSGEARGPVLRDRLYYYVSAQAVQNNTEVVDVGQSGAVAFLPTQSVARDQRYLGKLTWQAGARDNVNATLGYTSTDVARSGLAAFDSPESSYRIEQPRTFYNLSWQRSFTGRTFLEAKVSGFTGRDDELPYNGSDRPAVKVLGAPGQFRNSFYTRNNRPRNTSALLALDTYRTLAGMEHHLKLGGEYSVGSWREQRTRNGNLTWYFAPRGDATREQDASNPAAWQDLGFGDNTYATTDWGGAIDLNARVDQGAVWLQDYIQVTSRLSIAPGLRFGTWTGYLTPGNGGSELRGTSRFKAASTTAVDPRIGLNFDVTGRNDLVVKAHWGQYRQNMFSFMFDRAPGGNVFSDIRYYDWKDKTGATRPDLNRRYTEAERAQLFDAAGGASLFNEARAIENYRQPYMEQATLGVEKAIGRRYRAEVVYVNRRNKDVLSLVDRNLAGNWSRLANVAVTNGTAPVLDQGGRPLVLPELWVRNDDLRARLRAGDVIPGYTRADTSRLSFAQDLVITTVPEAERRFDQLQLNLNGTFSRATFTGGVAFTRLRGNVYSVNGYDNPTGQGVGPFVAPNARVNFYGDLPNYSPVEFKLRAAGEIGYGFQGGAFLQVFSGDAYTPSFTIRRRQLTYTVPGAGGTPVALNTRLLTNTDEQSLAIGERGSERYDTQARLDLRLERAFPTLRGQRVIVGLEMFNVLNANTVTAVKTNVNDVLASDPTSEFGAPRLRQAPRTLRLNAQYRF